MSSAAEIKSAIIDLDAKIQAEKDPAKKQAMTNDLARLFELHDAAMGASTPAAQMPITGRAGAMMRRGTPDVVGAVQDVGQAISESPAGQTFSAEMTQFGPEVRRRSAQIIGEELDLTDPGKVAGVAVSQAARAGGATLSSFIGSVIPNNIKEGSVDLYNNIKETEAFQLAADAASKGVAYYNDFAKRFPEEAEQFSTAVDLSALFGPRPDIVKADPSSSFVSGKAASARESARLASREVRQTGIARMLEPENRDITTRTRMPETGPLRTRTWQPDKFDQSVIDTLTDKVEGFNPNRSYTHNFVVVQDFIDSRKKRTDNMIASQNVEIDQDLLFQRMSESMADLKSDPKYRLSTGDEQKIADEVRDIAFELVQKHGTDLNGVITARRELDDALAKKYDNANDARGAAALRARRVLNETLMNNTEGDDLKEALTDQFHAITALETMLPKRNAEGGNIVSRLFKNLQNVANIPTSPLALNATVLSGVAILSATGGQVAALSGATLYGAFLAAKPKNRLKALAGLLSTTDNAIKTAKKGSEVAQQLQADRLLLVDLIDSARAEIQSGEEPNPN
tara:strand:- start:381 stop:2090 length:1710 start_codon:yes stop_codon:yes gene_type:complete